MSGSGADNPGTVATPKPGQIGRASFNIAKPNPVAAKTRAKRRMSESFADANNRKGSEPRHNAFASFAGKQASKLFGKSSKRAAAASSVKNKVEEFLKEQKQGESKQKVIDLLSKKDAIEDKLRNMVRTQREKKATPMSLNMFSRTARVI